MATTGPPGAVTGISFWGKTCSVALNTFNLCERPNEREPVRGKGAPSPLAERPPPPANTFQMEQRAQTTAAFRSRPQKKGELNSDQNLEREGIFLSSEAPKFPPRESCTDDVVQMKNLCMWGEKKEQKLKRRGGKYPDQKKKKKPFQQIQRRFISLSKRTIKQTRRRVGHEINERGAQATDLQRKTTS